MPAPADFDGDGQTDLAVFRPSTGQWFIAASLNGQVVTYSWGANGDVPVPADYDGDNRSDPGVFRPSEGMWYIVNSTAGIQIQQFGQNGDVPTQSSFIY